MKAFLASVALLFVSVLCHSAEAEMTKTERNRENAIKLVQAVFARNFLEAKKYLASSFKEFSLDLPEGRNSDEGLSLLKDMINQMTENMHAKIVRVVAEKNIVIVIMNRWANKNEQSTIDFVAELFLFNDDGLVVEHYDVAQKIPEHRAAKKMEL